MSKFSVYAEVRIDLDITNPDVIARVLENHDDKGRPQPVGPDGEKGWQDVFYRLDRDEVLQMLAYNLGIRRISTSSLDGWADLDDEACTGDLSDIVWLDVTEETDD